MASGVLPPALPMVRIGTDHYWDGGLVSNTPLQYLLETTEDEDVAGVSGRSVQRARPLPRDMYDVMARQKDIQYSSRTRLVTDYFRDRHETDLLLKRVLDKLPDDALNDDERDAKRRLATCRTFTILQLIYQQTAYEGQAKDYEFSGTSMREHWVAGYRDTGAHTPPQGLAGDPSRRRRYRRSRRPPAGRLATEPDQSCFRMMGIEKRLAFAARYPSYNFYDGPSVHTNVGWVARSETHRQPPPAPAPSMQPEIRPRVAIRWPA